MSCRVLPVLALLAVVVSVGVSCRPLEVPPVPGAGSVQGTLVFTPPGEAKRPAGGATVELLGTSISVTADTATGFFDLTPVPLTEGSVLIRYDADGDGVIDHARTFSLEALKAGPGKVTALGEVVLAGTASLRGAILRGDQLSAATGHGGSSAFTPAGPYLVFSGDNGAFSIDGLPEGDVSVAFFRQGYLSQQATVHLTAGETYGMPTIVLTRDPSTLGALHVNGSALLFGQSDSSGITVTTSGGQSTTTAKDGTWSLALAPGLYQVGFTKPGYATVVLRNVVVTTENQQVPAVILTPGNSTPPQLDAGQPPTFDAGVPDAGGTDAGETDAGNTDAGPADAGVADAGSPDSGAPDAGLPDAGPADAGAPDAGLPDAGASDAGVPDAGLPDAGIPTAVIGALPLYKTPSSFVSALNGSSSYGGLKPYSYKWTQTRPVTPVTLSANNATNAATPTFTAPSTPTVLGFTLTVTDALGVSSAPSAEATLPIGTPPTAVIAPGFPNPVYAGQTLTFDSAGSNDPSGTGLGQYLWTVSPAGLMTGVSTGPTFQVTTPATVTVSQVVTVTLTVVNNVGISSAPVSASVTLSNSPPPPWSVNAGNGQTVNGGDIVTISGSATTPGYTGQTFTWQWSPTNEVGAYGWALTNPTSPTTTFVAPIISGPNKLINLTLTATSTSGLTPLTASGTTFVNVLDKLAPTVVANGVNASGRAGTLGVTVDFSEALDPTSLSNCGVSPATTVDRVLTNGGTRLTLVTNPLIDGTSYNLYLQQWKDTAPVANGGANVSVPFVAEARVTPAYGSIDTSTTSPLPGLVLRDAADGGVEALAFGRNGTAPWFLNPVNPASCTTAPCPVATDTSAPTTVLGSALPKQNRGLRVGTTAYAQLQPRDYVNNVPAVAFTRTNGGWVPAPTPPGQLGTDGTKLYAAYVESGLKLATFDSVAGSWDTANALTVSSDTTLYAQDTSSAPSPMPAFSPPGLAAGPFWVASKASKSNDVRMYQQNGASWTTLGPWTNVTSYRLLNFSGNSTGLVFMLQGTALSYAYYNGLSWGPISVFASGVTAFDAMNRANNWWVAAVVNGQLQLRMQPAGTGTVVSVLNVGGVDSMNNSTSCTADAPEFAQLRDKVGLVWAESCSGGPWKIYFRVLN